MSYLKMNRGYGQDDLSCPPGEEWDWTAMACVTAGQATTPMPSVPTTLISIPQIPSVTPTPASPPQTQPQQASMMPWLIGGGVVVGGLLLIAALSKRSATPNRRRRRRPPKQWMKDCQSGVAAGARRSGRKISSTGAVCGAKWYGMSPAKRRAAKRRHYGK